MADARKWGGELLEWRVIPLVPSKEDTQIQEIPEEACVEEGQDPGEKDKRPAAVCSFH